MKRIHKYPIDLSRGNTHRILMPADAVILDCQSQARIPCIWAFGDPDGPTAHRHIAVYGTGHETPDDPGRYISTVQFGEFVFHFFEVDQ